MTKILLDDNLVRLIKAGGSDRQKAITLIYKDKKLKNQVIDFVKKNSGNREDGIDVFHEGIIAFDENVRKDKYRGQGNLKGYLFSICRFIWLNRLRRDKRMVYTDENTTFDEVSHETPESLSLMQEQKKILDSLLLRLGEKCEKVLELWKLSYSMEEIAKIAGLKNAGVARKQRYKCFQKLMHMINNDPQILNVLK
jgi:RNA polymerase sigma factor (sigma-70 family)